MSWNLAMRRWIGHVFSAALILSCSNRLTAVDQTLFAKVPQVSVLAISGDIEFEDLIPQQEGQSIAIVEDATSSYSVSNNATSSGKITAKLANAPRGLTIFATLMPPSGAVGRQLVQLSSSDQILVSELGKGYFSGNAIHYRVVADLDAVSALANFNALITYTLINSGS